ncbi:MAG: ornithine cyclodeaminase family protein [Acidobacteriota bacterium]|nr:ornithine cyclodeaminase family protein [Acidobacteriota bacterium]
MIYLTESDVAQLLPMPKCIDLMQQTFEQLASNDAINRPRSRVIMPAGSVLHYMAGATPRYFGAKVYSTHPKHGAHFVFLLYRTEDAQPLAILEANLLGQIRTGAASGLATKYMARVESETVGIIGSGFQAETQLAAMRAVRNVRTVRVWSRSIEKRNAFAAKLGVDAVETARHAVENSDIVITATNSKDPVVEAEWIAAGTHINAMGSNQASRRELPAGLLSRAETIAVDSIEQADMESGDLLLAKTEGRWKGANLFELEDIVTGKKVGRTEKTAITIFKSNGLAVEDVAAAGWVYEQAVEAGIGRKTYS